MGKTVLETPHLVLRELDPGDLDFVAAMLADPEVMRYWPRPYSREEAEGWVRRQRERYTRDGYGYWLAIERATGRPVGQAGLLAMEVDGVEEAALGYIIHRPFWRRGFAAEAAAATLDYAFGTLGKARVIAPIRPENEPSLAVARKLGMEAERPTSFAGFEHLIFAVSRPVDGVRSEET